MGLQSTHSAGCTVHTVLTAPLVSQSLLSRVLIFPQAGIYHRTRQRHHFCLPGMETSPATFLSPRVVFRKWSSCFGLHKSSLEAFSCGDVALHALPGLLVMWARRVFILQLKDTSTALVSFFLVAKIIFPISETVSVFLTHCLNCLNSIIYKMLECLHR